MTKLRWDEVGERHYYTGVDRGVLYTEDGHGYAWNGLTEISEVPSDAEVRPIFQNGIKTLNIPRMESFAVALTAYTYPMELDNYEVDDVFSPAVISGESQRTFNLSYRTLVDGNTHYQIHLVHKALASATEKSFGTINASVDAIEFGWNIATTPVPIIGARPSAHLIIDTRIAYPWAVQAVEDLLYGTDTEDAEFPNLIDIIAIFDDAAILKITDFGDGTWEADGPDDVVQFTSATSFEISWPSAIYISDDTYTVSTL